MTVAMNQLAAYLIGRKVNKFTPQPFYSKDGDFLTYYCKDADCYSERVDDVLTIYRSMDTGAFIGFKLKGIQQLLRAAFDREDSTTRFRDHAEKNTQTT